MATATVRARSCAEMPVVTPSRASIETVKAVSCREEFDAAISGSPSASSRSPGSVRQIEPAPVRRHEVDRVRRAHLRRDDEVALVLAVLVVDEDEHPPVARVLDDLLDRGDRVDDSPTWEGWASASRGVPVLAWGADSAAAAGRPDASGARGSRSSARRGDSPASRAASHQSRSPGASPTSMTPPGGEAGRAPRAPRRGARARAPRSRAPGRRRRRRMPVPRPRAPPRAGRRRAAVGEQRAGAVPRPRAAAGRGPRAGRRPGGGCRSAFEE